MMENTTNQEILLEGSEQYVLMMGDAVAIAWNAKPNQIVIGRYRFSGSHWQKEGEPYIDFVALGRDDDGYYADEDSPVEGGFDAEYGRKIIAELERACEWLERVRE